MKHLAAVLLSSFTLSLLGCAEPTPSRSVPDAPIVAIDAPGNAVTIPTWRLEDVQPASPRTGQTYGLDVFTNRIIVVSLLEGF